MAVYKVPQDVEAEDKLIGPFSFRQFIYLIIVAISIGLLVLFFTKAPAFLGFVMLIVLLPVIVTFGALALPLRKDQPMETYLLAVLRFYLKPRNRLWIADGSLASIEITAPKTVEYGRTNGLSQAQAASSLNYLAQLMDSRGWSAKGVVSPMAAMGSIAVSEADISTDVLDENAPIARSFDKLMAQSQAEARQAAIDRMTQQSAPDTPPAAPENQSQTSDPWAELDEKYGAAGHPSYNPYPSNLHQKVIQPLSAQRHAAARPAMPASNPASAEPAAQQPSQPKSTTDNAMPSQVSPDIMKLVTESNNLSISTLANEAHRLEKKAADDGEVVISLR